MRDRSLRHTVHYAIGYPILMRMAPCFGLFFERLELLLSDNVQGDEPLFAYNVITSHSHRVRSCFPVLKFSINRLLNFFCLHLEKTSNSLTLTTTSPTKVCPTSPIVDWEHNALRTSDQSIILWNLDYTGGSIESVDDDNPSHMIATLIYSTLYHLGMDFRQVLLRLYTGTSG